MRRISIIAIFYISCFMQAASSQVDDFGPRQEGAYYDSDPGISVKCEEDNETKALPLKQGELFWGLSFKQAEADGVLNQAEYVLDQAFERISRNFPITAKTLSSKVSMYLKELEARAVTHTLGGKVTGLPDNCIPDRVIRIVRSPIDSEARKIILSTSGFSKLGRVSQAALILQGALMDSRYFNLTHTGLAASDLEYFTALLLSDQILKMSKVEFIFRTYDSPSFRLLEWFEVFGARLTKSEVESQRRSLCGDAFQASEKIDFRSKWQPFTSACFNQDYSQALQIKFVKPVEVDATPQGQRLIIRSFDHSNLNVFGESGAYEILTLGQDHQTISGHNYILRLNQRSDVTLRENGSIILADIHHGEFFRDGKWEKLRKGIYYFNLLGDAVLINE